MIDDRTNLRVLKPSRKRPHTGDLFAMQLPDEAYLFGRVIGADLEPPQAPMPVSYLVYIYEERSRTVEPPVDALAADRLLLPPLFINRLPWTKGYFQLVGHREVSRDDLLDRHCFWSAARGAYVDENCNALPAETQPCGDWALMSYRWLDDRISSALGFARVSGD